MTRIKWIVEINKKPKKARLFMPLEAGTYEIVRSGGIYTPGYRALFNGQEFIAEGFGNRTGIFKRQPYMAMQACDAHYKTHNGDQSWWPGNRGLDWRFETRPDGAKVVIGNHVYRLGFSMRQDRYGHGGGETHHISLDGQRLAKRHNLFHALTFVESHAVSQNLIRAAG